MTEDSDSRDEPLRVLVFAEDRITAELAAFALDAHSGVSCTCTTRRSDVPAALHDGADRPDVVVLIERGVDDEWFESLTVDDGARPTRSVVALSTDDPAQEARGIRPGWQHVPVTSGRVAEGLLDAVLRPSGGDRLVRICLVADADSGVPPTRVHAALTERERQVLQSLVRGLDARQTARELGISINTCRGHIKRLHHKLNARSQVEVVTEAIRLGVVDMPGRDS